MEKKTMRETKRRPEQALLCGKCAGELYRQKGGINLLHLSNFKRECPVRMEKQNAKGNHS